MSASLALPSSASFVSSSVPAMARSARWKDGAPALLAVVAVHAALLAAVLLGLRSPVPDAITPPTLAGVLVAEASQELTPPKPTSVPQPKPQPVARPRPAPPAVKVPPTERSITAPEERPEDVRPDPTPDAPVESAQAKPSVATPDTRSDAPAQATPPVMPVADASHLSNPAPVYPDSARRRGEQGTVHIDLLVLANGTVGEIGLKRSSGYPELDESALRAVARWRFVPASRGGVLIDFRYALPVNFTLRR